MSKRGELLEAALAWAATSTQLTVAASAKERFKFHLFDFDCNESYFAPGASLARMGGKC